MSKGSALRVDQSGCDERYRVGVINLMPQAQTYESGLRSALGSSDLRWIRLSSHGYASSDPDTIAGYRNFDQVAEEIDGLIVTGAPVEQLPFAEVHYWSELSSILRDARANKLPVLGLCWGGLALAASLGVGKRNLPGKLFGVFEHHVSHLYRAELGPTHCCPQSRHATLDGVDLARALKSGLLQVIAHSTEVGPTLLRSYDGLCTIHLGHPEYDERRLLLEWERDVQAGRSDVNPPVGYDLAARSPYQTWSMDRARFFGSWLLQLRGQRCLEPVA